MQRLRHPSAGLAALLALGLGAAIVAAVFAAAAAHKSIEWPRFDLGTVPAWLSFLASLGTFIGIWVAYVNLRTTRENRRDDETSPARLLVIDRVTAAYGSEYPTVLVTLRNVGPDTFTDVQVTGVTLCGIGCQQTVYDHWHERTHDSHSIVQPGANLKSGWVLPIKGFTKQEETRPEVQFEYSDGKGRRWRRLGSLDPQRIPAPKVDPDRRQRFEAALASRPGGRRNADIHINLAIGQIVPDEDDD